MRKNVSKKDLASWEKQTKLSPSAEHTQSVLNWAMLGGALAGALATYGAQAELCSTSTNFFCQNAAGVRPNWPIWVGGGVGGLLGLIVVAATAD